MKEKPKILIIHNQVTPYRLPIFEALNNFFDVTVYFCELRSGDRLWKTNLIKRYKFNWKILKGVRIGRFILNSPKNLFKTLKEWNAYIIADNVENIPMTWITVTVAKILRKPVIVWSEKIKNPWDDMYVESSLIKKIALNLHEWLLFSLSDKIVGYSKKARKYLEYKKVPLWKIIEGIQVMPEELLPKIKQQTCKKSVRCKRIVLYVGYLRPGKGVENLIKAFLSINTDACLLIVGTGPLKKVLEERYSRSKKIVFYGYAEGEELSYLYNTSSILVLPTLKDSWGLVVNESLYFGTPVITTTAAGASTIIEEGKTGFVVPATNLKDLKDKLDWALNNPKVIKKMKIISKNAGKRYANKGLGTRPFIKALNEALI